MADRAFIQQMTKKLADDGKLIEAGWMGMRLHVIPLDAPPDQLREMRLAFMAGAQHLLASMLDIMDPDHEPTDADIRRIELIHNELEAFRAELEARIKKTPNH